MDTPDPLPIRTLKDLGISEAEHPTWMGAFNRETRSEQLHEDHAAWSAVTGLLLTIITIGASLAVFTVILCLS